MEEIVGFSEKFGFSNLSLLNKSNTFITMFDKIKL